MSSTKNSIVSTDPIPRNKSSPVRIAFLGGPKTGKTSIISQLVTKHYRETYYPLRKTNPVLYTYRPSAALVPILDPLDKNAHEILGAQDSNLILSPVMKHGLSRTNADASTTSLSEIAQTLAKNKVYHVNTSSNQTAKTVTPILTELIDTPAFEPDRSVPFLEVSLHAKLAKDVLRNLANDAGHSVNAEPLLVASGAAELNGAIDGYVLVYSAVPPAQIPAYDADSKVLQPTKTSLSDLPVIRNGLIEAWSEYYMYRTQHSSCGESDIFSLKNAFKNMFDTKVKKEVPLRGKPESISQDPYDKLCLPPILIVCTHKNLPLMSPNLIEKGKNYAKQWNCSFIAVDASENVDITLDLMLREIIERREARKTK